MYTDYKIGLIFSRLDSTQPLLEDGVTVAYNSGREHYIQHIADANGVKLNPIEYKNSKEIVLAVLNGEVDFGYTDSAKHVWKNADQLLPHYNLSGEILDGVPSVSEIGGQLAATLTSCILAMPKTHCVSRCKKKWVNPNLLLDYIMTGKKV